MGNARMPVPATALDHESTIPRSSSHRASQNPSRPAS